ncbi:hypothetical protein [Metasolibacillus meyeri]|uniref:hypothetical protein n=1 Tax=Metasolibacillus meyeri TaxID=1071052 RepID=UPI000D2FFBB5|nr:hypothetical protein [Metasolibacillus meyeri]
MDKKNEENLPWYLRKNPSIVIAIISPPIAYLIVAFNLKKMDTKTRKDRFSFATIMAAIWSLRFIPRNTIGITFIVILYLSFIFLTIWVIYKLFRK